MRKVRINSRKKKSASTPKKIETFYTTKLELISRRVLDKIDFLVWQDLEILSKNCPRLYHLRSLLSTSILIKLSGDFGYLTKNNCLQILQFFKNNSKFEIDFTLHFLTKGYENIINRERFNSICMILGRIALKGNSEKLPLYSRAFNGLVEFLFRVVSNYLYSEYSINSSFGATFLRSSLPKIMEGAGGNLILKRLTCHCKEILGQMEEIGGIERMTVDQLKSLLAKLNSKNWLGLNYIFRSKIRSRVSTRIDKLKKQRVDVVESPRMKKSSLKKRKSGGKSIVKAKSKKKKVRSPKITQFDSTKASPRQPISREELEKLLMDRGKIQTKLGRIYLKGVIKDLEDLSEGKGPRLKEIKRSYLQKFHGIFIQKSNSGSIPQVGNTPIAYKYSHTFFLEDLEVNQDFNKIVDLIFENCNFTKIHSLVNKSSNIQRGVCGSILAYSKYAHKELKKYF